MNPRPRRWASAAPLFAVICPAIAGLLSAVAACGTQTVVVGAGHCDPNGHGWIGFDSDRGGLSRNIFAIQPDGTGLIQITSDASNQLEAAFSPDGTSMAFVSDRVESTFQLFVLDLKTKTVRQLTSMPLGADEPAWSPDGLTVAFHSNSGVYLIPAAGGSVTMVFQGGQDGGNTIGYPTFTPDGNHLLVDRAYEIVSVNLDGSNPQYVFLGGSTPAVSPDGTQVAVSDSCGGGVEGVWVASVGATSSDPCAIGHRVSPADGVPAARPAWTANGAIAYEAGTANRDIWLSSGSAAPTNLTNGAGDNHNPAWIPACALVQ